MAQWIISKYDSLELLQEWRIPGNISAGQIEELLKRLASRDLTEMEVINSSLRKNSEIGSIYLIVRVLGLRCMSVKTHII